MQSLLPSSAFLPWHFTSLLFISFQPHHTLKPSISLDFLRFVLFTFAFPSLSPVWALFLYLEGWMSHVQVHGYVNIRAGSMFIAGFTIRALLIAQTRDVSIKLFVIHPHIVIKTYILQPQL